MAFSYQEHHPFLLDSLYLTQHVGEMAGAASSCFLYPYSPQAVAAASDAGAYDGSSCTLDTCRNVPSVDNHIVSSPPSHDVENVLKQQGCIMENKRKRGDEASLISGDSQDVKKGRSRKQKRSSGGLKGTDEKKSKTGEGKGSKACSDPSVGFVHVRARRGQATDSHSLAERVRREKISERMKMLQGLVPGCEKVTGKALMLDEIINYVQSLQNQVEFLSMKIASLSPIFYNMDFDDCINQSQFQKLMRSIPEPVPSVDQTSHLQAKVFGNGGTNYQMMDHSTPPNLLQQVQGPSTFSQGGGCVPQVGAQRQGFDDQLGFANMCSFQ